MKQIKVSVPDDLLTQLEEAAAKDERSLSDEVRRRLKGTAGHVVLGRPDIDELFDTIFDLVVMAESTSSAMLRWNQDPAVAYVLQLAITRLLQRYGAKEVNEILPGKLVASTNPAEVATALETLVYFKRNVRAEERRRIDERRALAMADRGMLDERRKETATPTEPNVEGEKHNDQ
jgi:hypothetical protein